MTLPQGWTPELNKAVGAIHEEMRERWKAGERWEELVREYTLTFRELCTRILNLPPQQHDD